MAVQTLPQLLASELPCLPARGSTVIQAVIYWMFYDFNQYLSGVTPEFSCNIDASSNRVTCAAATGSTVIQAATAAVLCELLTNLKAGIGASGTVDPENNVIGLFKNMGYLNTATDTEWHFKGTPGTKVGWVA